MIFDPLPRFVLPTQAPPCLAGAKLPSMNDLTLRQNVLDVRDETFKNDGQAVPPNQVGILVEHLEGWWFAIVIRSLCEGPRSILVSGGNASRRITPEGFSRDALPVDYAAEGPLEHLNGAAATLRSQSVQRVLPRPDHLVEGSRFDRLPRWAPNPETHARDSVGA
jgi:hypothetical protein